MGFLGDLADLAGDALRDLSKENNRQAMLKHYYDMGFEEGLHRKPRRFLGPESAPTKELVAEGNARRAAYHHGYDDGQARRPNR